MQSSFGAKLGGRCEDEERGRGGNLDVRGWMRGGKQERGSAVMLSNLVRGSFFLCCAPPYRLGY